MTRTTRESGFSLVEVVIALGILAGVLISIAGLFSLGGKQLKSGRSSTEALSIARDILEEMEGWGFRQTYEVFGFDGTAASYTLNTKTNSFASKWQPAIDAKLLNGVATIQIESLARPTLPPPALNATRAIRVTVTVSWQEGLRNRSTSLRVVRL